MSSCAEPFVCRDPKAVVLLHGRLAHLAEDVDLDFGSGDGQIGAQHAQRDGFSDAVAPVTDWLSRPRLRRRARPSTCRARRDRPRRRSW